MANQNPGKITRKVSNSFSNLLTWIAKRLSSLLKFAKASVLSLFFIIVLVLLITKMDQAFTMLIDLMEGKAWRVDLMITFFFLIVLALALSHYPIYNYYASNLNDSASFTTWYAVYPFIRPKKKRKKKKKKGKKSGKNDDICGIKRSQKIDVSKYWLRRLFKVFVFIEEKPENTKYTKDDFAHYLRYLLGMLILMGWMLFILNTFLPKFDISPGWTSAIKWFIIPVTAIPFTLYVLTREGLKKVTEERKDIVFRRLAAGFTVVVWLLVVCLLICFVVRDLYSPFGFTLLLMTTYLLMFFYVYFRLVRTKLDYMNGLYKGRKLSIVGLNVRILRFLFFCSQDYLMLFSFSFIFSVLIIIGMTIAVFSGTDLPNGIPILMAFIFFYYFIIASFGKYFFAYKKIRKQKTEKQKKKKKEKDVPKEHTLRFKIVSIGLIVLAILAIVSAFTPSKVHQLSLIEEKGNDHLNEADFLKNISGMEQNTVFFISSHGGGLKSNAWTLKVMEELYKRSEGRLIDRTVAFSGASGGSLGLALYTALSEHLTGNMSADAELLKNRISEISTDNYTSSDLTLTFGLDTWRKLWPLNLDWHFQDRPYYSMQMYEGHVKGEKVEELSTTSYRSLWNKVYKKNEYFPSLIMNTASTKGKRGIFWSVESERFDSIFHFSENLADAVDYEDLSDKTISYYEAVSTTNRFPFFSPAAKIPGYGHYIDAGAIDNSGLLGCLDLYFHYEQTAKKDEDLEPKAAVFIEIINSKDIYTEHILTEFIKEYIPINENESNNIKADLDTALNLDKIPGYVSQFIETNPNLDIYRIYMPHKITIKDIHSHLKGKIEKEDLRNKIEKHLDSLNNELYKMVESDRPETSIDRFFTQWQSYEPKLSRHLSESSLYFMDKVIATDAVQEGVNDIMEKLNEVSEIQETEIQSDSLNTTD